MVDPTPLETLIAAAWFFIGVTCVVWVVADLGRRVRNGVRNAVKSNAEIDARSVYVEHYHAHKDPLAPDAEYGATRAATQQLRKGGK